MDHVWMCLVPKENVRKQCAILDKLSWRVRGCSGDVPPILLWWMSLSRGVKACWRKPIGRTPVAGCLCLAISNGTIACLLIASKQTRQKGGYTLFLAQEQDWYICYFLCKRLFVVCSAVVTDSFLKIMIDSKMHHIISMFPHIFWILMCLNFNLNQSSACMEAHLSIEKGHSIMFRILKFIWYLVVLKFYQWKWIAN